MVRTGTYKAQAFDILQYFYGTTHDPIIHCLIRLDGAVDASILIKAVTLSLEAVPILGCGFDGNERRPRWWDRGYTGADIVRVTEAGADAGMRADSLLADTIDIQNGPQLRIHLIRAHADGDTLCVLVNHMVCDAAGFKDYLYLLAELYTLFSGKPDALPVLRDHPRSGAQLFRGMPLRRRLRILLSKYDLSALRRQDGVRLEGDMNNPFFVSRQLDAETVRLIREHARSLGATFNDMVLAAYARALRKMTGACRIILPCPVDLRKYLRKETPPGICNLTSNYILELGIGEGDTFRTTLLEVSRRTKLWKESDGCLKSVVLLEFICRALSFRTIKKNFNKLFTIPRVSYSNLGVLDEDRLSFGGTAADDVFMTGAVKNVPYFQVAVSTFKNRATLSCNLHGTENDRRRIEDLLSDMADELIAASGTGG